MYRLMIKTHNKTGLKYLCITKQKDFEKYTGSGTKWKNHLKKHGVDISTEVIHETEDYEEFVQVCVYYSTMFDVVMNEEFANLIPESGYDGKEFGKTNFEVWREQASPDELYEFYRNRSKSIKEFHDNNPGYLKGRVDNEKLSDSLKTHWGSLSSEERKEKLENMKQGFFDFYNSEESKAWRDKLKTSSRKYWANISEEELSKRSKAVSLSRLSMSDEAKRIRGEKVSEAFKNSESRKAYEEKMRVERLGAGNPASKKITWYGELYSKGEFTKKFGTPDSEENQKIFSERDDCFLMYDNTKKTYEVLECPYCGKKSNPESSPSPFKRWHFGNCKKKTVNE